VDPQLALFATLADELRIRPLEASGPGRLLRELVRIGLAPDALTLAAALVLTLDEEASCR
jgi:hypothetical protein